MDMNRKTVLVTGSNKGIGYGIIEGLLAQGKYRVILTSRNEELGMKSYNILSDKFKEEKENFFYHQLDITKETSIAILIQWIKEKFTKLDYLVNNAGVATKGSTFNIEVAKSTFEVNVYGTISFTEEMIKQNVINNMGKIIFVGSCSGFLNKLKKKELYLGFKNAKTKEDLLQMGEKFFKSIENNTVEQDGWCFNTYSVSKMIVNCYPRILSYRKEIKDNNIGVYVCHPGWVRTDMAGPKAPLTIQQGALTELYVIGLPDGIHEEVQGKYFSDSKLATFEETDLDI